MMEKERYERTDLEIFRFTTEYVITTSESLNYEEDELKMI